MENIKFSREEMHQELRMALYQTVRCIRVISNEKVGSVLFEGLDFKKPENGPLWLLDADSVPDDFNFDPKAWVVVDTMDRLYDYAILGVARLPIYRMADETEYTMAAAYVYDTWNMKLVREMTMGDGVSLAKCHHVAELGAARVALDGGERYFGFDRNTPDSALTIREIALLAGMEESSVRNAAVKGKAGALKTFQEDGSTLVAREDALEWLKGRKGFVPTTFRDELGEIDLVSHSFATLNEVDEFMDARLKTLGFTPERLAKRMKVSPKSMNVKSMFGLYFADGGARDQEALERLAGLLNISADVFVLRVRETINLEEARGIRRALAELTAAKRVN